MIACVEKTAQNADFYQIIDYLTGCSINYSLLVDPDLIGPWLQQFWTTASLRVINDVPADPFFDDIVDKDAAVAPDIERKSNETEVLERKSDETEEINVEEKEASNVKS
ncbi:hypothetical protein Tco_0398988, partial [Tanacetum coccineum]